MNRPLKSRLVRSAAAILVAVIALTGLSQLAVWRLERSIVRPLPMLAREPVKPKTPIPEPVFRPSFETNTGPTRIRPLNGERDLAMGDAPSSEVVLPLPTEPSTDGVDATQRSMEGWNGKQRINVALLGLAATPQRDVSVDTILLASLDFEHNQLYVLSVPRKLYVQVPSFEYATINTVYALGERPGNAAAVGGGAGLMINTLRQNFGIDEIDGYGTFRYEGFVRGIDAIGGIDVPMDTAIDGVQHMDGSTALATTRTDGASKVVLAVWQKIRQPSVLLQLPSLLGIVGDSIETSFSVHEQWMLAQWVANLPDGHVQIATMDVPERVTLAGEVVLDPDWTAIQPMIQQLYGTHPDAAKDEHP